MARLLKCYGWCGSKYEKKDLIEYKNKNYCSDCYRKKVEDDEGRDKLLKVISYVYNIPYPTGMMLRQMKNFRDDRDYKYHEQADALLYGKNVLNKKFESKFGLGLIPYIIEDSKKYLKDNEERVEKMKNIDNINQKEEFIKKKKEVAKDFYKKHKMINMDGVLDE